MGKGQRDDGEHTSGREKSTIIDFSGLMFFLHESGYNFFNIPELTQPQIDLLMNGAINYNKSIEENSKNKKEDKKVENKTKEEKESLIFNLAGLLGGGAKISDKAKKKIEQMAKKRMIEKKEKNNG